jgi:hypothetical protein
MLATNEHESTRMKENIQEREMEILFVFIRVHSWLNRSFAKLEFEWL